MLAVFLQYRSGGPGEKMYQDPHTRNVMFEGQEEEEIPDTAPNVKMNKISAEKLLQSMTSTKASLINQSPSWY